MGAPYFYGGQDMAATKLITMHQNMGLSVMESIANRIKYATNGEKTEDGQYISCYECDVKTAIEEFSLSKKEYLRITGRVIKGDILAYQIRQSFKPGEVTPEEANAIGYETAMRFTKGNHAFLVATHTDKAHIHNHILYNSTTLDCTHKFKDFFLVGLALQRLSDEICLEHGLSVISPRPFAERVKRTEFPWKKTKRATVCEDIDVALSRNPRSFAELLAFLNEMGYEIKAGAHTSIRGRDQKRFIRFRSLGSGYTEEDLTKIITGEMQPDEKTSRWKNREAWRKGADPVYKKREFDLLVDIEAKLRRGKGKGYERWAKIFNLKAIIMGRLTKDIDIRNADTDKKVARGTLAVNRNFKKEGEDQAADFINLVAFGKQADFLEKFGKKGIKFIVTGRIQTGSYDKDGTKIYTTDVVVEQIEFAESKSASEKAEGETGDGFVNVPEGFDEGLPFN